MPGIPTGLNSWSIRTRLAFTAGKCCIAALSLARRLKLPWGGTTLPGKVALRVDHNILAVLCRRYQGLILITGTNGKTSTTALLVELLESTGLRVVSNSEGANMVPGLLTALLKAETWNPVTQKEHRPLAVFEVDEGSLLPLSRLTTNVDTILVTNLFPDQLDRYGSVTALAKLMQKAIASWPNATLLLNADDPKVTAFGLSHNPVRYFGLRDQDNGPDIAGSSPDKPANCPVCGQELAFSSYNYAHLGNYNCPTCGFRRPAEFVVIGSPADNRQEIGSSYTLYTAEGDKEELKSTLTGLYNGYNIVAAAAATMLWKPKTKLASLAPVIAAFKAPSGRTEHFFWSRPKKRGTLILVKNAAGFNQALDTAVGKGHDTKAGILVVAINDLPADGRDTSWLQNTNIDAISAHIPIICSGRRAHDVAACFKRLGVSSKRLTIIPKPDRAVKAALARPVANMVFLCNYTLLASLRKSLLSSGGSTATACPVLRK